MKRSINIKYFLLFIFLGFNSFGTTSVAERDYLVDFTENANAAKISALSYYPEELTKKVSNKLDSIFNRYNKRYDFHGSVIVAKKGKVVFKNHYGYADFKNKTKIDDGSVFQLASVSKQFTAAAILILQEDNKLNIDDLVADYVSDWPYEGVTIRHLMNHTGGLPKYFWLAEHKWNQEHVPSNEEMMELLTTEKVQRYFSANANFDYSNTGYFVLSYIVEQVSGQEFGDFLDQEIFEPLNMNQSFVYRFGFDEEKEGQLAGYRIYRRRWHAEIKGTVNDGVVGDKNVYSTTEDMLKWVQGLNSGKILSESSVAQMYTRGETKFKRKVPYGFGFRIKEGENGDIVYHNGKWNGFSTSLMQYPEDELVVITLEHSKYNSMKTLNQKVKTIVEQNFSE